LLQRYSLRIRQAGELNGWAALNLAMRYVG